MGSRYRRGIRLTCQPAITVTSPADNAEWKDGDKNTVKWTSVEFVSPQLRYLIP